jgi:hypothetical protein
MATSSSDISSAFNSNSDKELINANSLSEEIILNKINNLRSNLQLTDGEQLAKDKNNTPIPIKESFCHAFYRMLGLPVIDFSLMKFYNPGFYGSEQNINVDDIKSIDNNQDPNLSNTEDHREITCYENILAFEKPDPKFQYRLDMLKQRMNIDILDENIDAFFLNGNDPQNIVLTKRALYRLVRKYLRPFKCCSKLTNNVYPITNSVCAPFISENNSVINSTSLPKPYLEFVIRTRFFKDLPINSKKESTLYNTLKQQIKLALPQELQQSLKMHSELEDYISTQMFQSLFYICKNVGAESKRTIKIVEQINEKIKVSQTDDEPLTFDAIDNAIEKLKSQIAAKELVLSILPNYTIKDSTGADINIQNNMNCPLISPFIKLVQPNLDDLKKQVDYLNTEKQKRLTLLNSLNKSIFYVIGEVNGIGLIDIISIMLAFWLIPKDHLLSMLDTPSFLRLYREPNLQSEEVVDRHLVYNDQPKINIGEVINVFDKTIVQILKTCEQIIIKNSV